MSHKINNISRDKNYTDDLNRNSGVEKYTKESKHSLEGLNSKFEMTGKRISELEDRLICIASLKNKKEKKEKKQIFRNLWETTKCNHINVKEVSKEDKK